MRPDLVATWIFRVIDGRPEIYLARRASWKAFPGVWQCPTGKLEPGETILGGALRELAEETGLRPADLEAVFETEQVNWFHVAAEDAVVSEVAFAARVRVDAEVRLSPEHDAGGWLDPAAAVELVPWPAYVRAIEHIVSLVARPAIAEVEAIPDALWAADG